MPLAIHETAGRRGSRSPSFVQLLASSLPASGGEQQYAQSLIPQRHSESSCCYESEAPSCLQLLVPHRGSILAQEPIEASEGVPRAASPEVPRKAAALRHQPDPPHLRCGGHSPNASWLGVQVIPSLQRTGFKALANCSDPYHSTFVSRAVQLLVQ